MICFFKKNYLKLINISIILTVLILSILSYTKSKSDLSLALAVIASISFVYTFATCLYNQLKSNNINNLCSGNYDKLFENLNECLIIYSRKNHKIRFVSDNCYAATGFTKSKICNFSKIQTVDGKNVLEEIKKHIFNKSTSTLKLWIYNPSKNKNCLFEIKYKRFNQFKRELYNIVFADITAQYYEQSLLSEKLSESEKTRKEFEMYLSKVSHELRTPLNGVLGMNSIAIDALQHSNHVELEKCLYSIDKSGKYLLSIINNVLDLSKIGNGKMNVNSEMISLDNLFNEIISILASQMQTKNVDYLINSDLNDILIMSDKLKLSQIFTNLLSNAIKYNKENGFIKIDITSKILSKERVNVKIEIKDTGVGMSKDVLDTLFTPYSSGNTRNPYDSTGLGLAITKSLVTLLGGNITCESDLDVGTRFILEFVFNKVDEVDVEILNENHYDFSKFKALIVEDNDINALICENYLKKFKIETTTVSNGQECIDILNEKEEGFFDFILMDIQMPVLNGYEATEIIRNFNNLNKDIIIIAMTADAFTDDINKAFLYKMDGHISKPLVVETMMSTIKDLLVKKCVK